MDGRVLVIPPAVRKSIMGIDRYVSSDFVGGRGVESGLIGNLYGVDIYVSSNAPVLEVAAQNSVSTADTRGCLFFHKDALRHSTSRNTCLRCLRLTRCTVLRLIVPKQDSSSLSATRMTL
jgi:hypothetical protein